MSACASAVPSLPDLAPMRAEERVAWALQNLPGTHIVSSSFGAQAAVMLHLLTAQQADIPVVLIDTGYLFPETYRFVDRLSDRLHLNLHVYRSTLSPAWQEARYGERWNMGADALREYNQQAKVEPMQRALQELSAGTWFAGLRREQSDGRRATPLLDRQHAYWKVHPIADWSNQDVHRYLVKHRLPYHPLWEHGYESIGDYHTSKSIHEVSDRALLRFHGLKRECGIHEIEFTES